MSISENKARSLQGELYHAFTPELLGDRTRCLRALRAFNNSEDDSRRTQVQLWRNIVDDKSPLPLRREGSTDEEDDALFDDEPYVCPPFRADNGANIRTGTNVFINAYCVIVDTCIVSIGSRVMFGPSVSLYSGCHPLDPDLRNGLKGPEMGKEIHIEDDCWIGGNAILLPGVRIGKGSTVGAGSVVTKDVPEYSVVAGNPARVIKAAPRNSISEEERQRVYDIAMNPR